MPKFCWGLRCCLLWVTCSGIVHVMMVFLSLSTSSRVFNSASTVVSLLIPSYSSCSFLPCVSGSVVAIDESVRRPVAFPCSVIVVLSHAQSVWCLNQIICLVWGENYQVLSVRLGLPTPTWQWLTRLHVEITKSTPYTTLIAYPCDVFCKCLDLETTCHSCDQYRYYNLGPIIQSS